jgi:hypothetical protein
MTDAVREGITPRSGLGGLRLGVEKLAGAVPMGIDAPSKGMRKAIGGGWELLSVLRYGFLALVLLIIGVACCYLGARGPFEIEVLALGVGSLALAALFARWTLKAARNLRSIGKA